MPPQSLIYQIAQLDDDRLELERKIVTAIVQFKTTGRHEKLAQWAQIRILEGRSLPEVRQALGITVKEENRVNYDFIACGAYWFRQFDGCSRESANRSLVVQWITSTAVFRKLSNRRGQNARNLAKPSDARGQAPVQATRRNLHARSTLPATYNPTQLVRVPPPEHKHIDAKKYAGTCGGCPHLARHWRGYACGTSGMWVGETIRTSKIPAWCPSRL